MAAAALDEKEALDWAIKYFRDCAAHLTIQGSKRFHEELLLDALMRVHDGDWTEGRNLIYSFAVDYARNGEPLAIQGLCQFAAELIERGEQLPDAMRIYR